MKEYALNIITKAFIKVYVYGNTKEEALDSIDPSLVLKDMEDSINIIDYNDYEVEELC